MEKKSKSTIIATIVLTIFLIMAIVYLIIDSKKNREEIINPIENNTIVVDELDENATNAYNNLLLKNKKYGFYYGVNVNIDDISNEKMIKYALSDYILNNNIEVKGDISCYVDKNTNSFKKGNTKNSNCKGIIKIKKSLIDEYIKNKFNTDRIFSVSNKLDTLPLDGNSYVFDGKSVYYVGLSSDNGYEEVFTKYLKAEKDDNNLYIYDKAFTCKPLISGYAECKKGYDSDEIIFSKEYNINDGIISEVTDESYNVEFITNSYDSVIDTYKHTFKIVGDNYFWISSEITN